VLSQKYDASDFKFKDVLSRKHHDASDFKFKGVLSRKHDALTSSLEVCCHENRTLLNLSL